MTSKITPSVHIHCVEEPGHHESEYSQKQKRDVLDRIYSSESRGIPAALISLLGDFDPAEDAQQHAFEEEAKLGEDVEDDQLRLILACSHTALAPEARVALTLRGVFGLTTEEISRDFLTTPPTPAKRIVRAKAKMRGARVDVSGAGAAFSREAQA